MHNEPRRTYPTKITETRPPIVCVSVSLPARHACLYQSVYINIYLADPSAHDPKSIIRAAAGTSTSGQLPKKH